MSLPGAIVGDYVVLLRVSLKILINIPAEITFGGGVSFEKIS